MLTGKIRKKSIIDIINLQIYLSNSILIKIKKRKKEIKILKKEIKNILNSG